jgi:WD40 repeat protein
MSDARIETTITGGQIQGIAAAGTVVIENFTIYSHPVDQVADPETGAEPNPACPYPGLEYFGPGDADRFFGRDATITRLAETVDRQSLTALVGASGSGKSSVVLAGLAPRLHSAGGWRFSHFRTGTELESNPFLALARALVPLYVASDSDTERLRNTRLLATSLETGDLTLRDIFADCRNRNKGTRILLIADQFEEAFTLVEDEPTGHRFVDVLLAGFPDPAPGKRPDICLILTLRADFFGRALRHRPLADALQGHVENLGPMNREELQAAVCRPAENAKVSFDPGLVETLLDEVESKPGSLPLLQFALREMWGLQEKRKVTRKSYDNIGGIQGALAQRAETIFAAMTGDGSNPQMAQAFRRLFTRLVTPGEGQEDTRRIVERRELGGDAWSLAQRLASEDNRLIVTNAPAFARETAEVVHESLIRHWPRLVGWIDRDRALQIWLRQIRANVDLWSADPADEGALLRGGVLAQAEDWLDKQRDELSPTEIDFIEASLALRDREARAKEAAQRAELDRQRQVAVSHSLRLAIAARGAATTLPETALLLAGEAFRLDHNAITDEVVREMVSLMHADVVRLGDQVVYVAFGPADTILTLLKDGRAQFFDRDGHHLRDFRIDGGPLVSGALSPDGRTILAVAADGRAYLYAIADTKIALFPAWTQLSTYGHLSVRWSPDGSTILATDQESAWLWSLDDQQASAPWDNRKEYNALISHWAALRRDGGDAQVVSEQIEQLRRVGHVQRVFDASFSLDGTQIATASEDATVQLWDRQGRHLATFSTETEPAIAVTFVGGALLSGHMDKKARLWDATGKLVAQLSGHGADVRHVLFSPNGNCIATAVNGGGERDGVIRLWDRVGLLRLTLEEHTDFIGALVFSDDGRLLVSGSWDRTVRLWTVEGNCLSVLHGHTEPVVQVALDRSGNRLLSCARDGEARLWRVNVATTSLVASSEAIVAAATYWGDDRLVVSSAFDGSTVITRLSDGATCASLPGMSAMRPGAERTMIMGNKLWTIQADAYIGHTLGMVRNARIHCFVRNAEDAIAAGPSFNASEADEAGEFRSFILSPTGDMMLIQLSDRVELISVADECRTVLNGPNYNKRENHSVDFAAFSADGRYIVTASINGSLWLWRSTGELVGGRLIDGASAHDNLFDIAMSPQGCTLLTAIRGQADLWDATLGHIATLRCATNKVKRSLFSPDGTRILTIAESAIPDMRLWDADGCLIATLPVDDRCNPDTVVFATTAPLIAWPRDRTLHLFDLEGQRVAQLATALDNTLRALAFDPTGKKVAIASYGQDIQVWTLDDGGQLLTTLKGHTKEINSLQFSRDGMRLLSSSSDGTVRQFIVDPDALIADAERHVARVLSPEEVERYAIPLPLRFGPPLPLRA